MHQVLGAEIFSVLSGQRGFLDSTLRNAFTYHRKNQIEMLNSRVLLGRAVEVFFLGLFVHGLHGIWFQPPSIEEILYRIEDLLVLSLQNFHTVDHESICLSVMTVWSCLQNL